MKDSKHYEARAGKGLTGEAKKMFSSVLSEAFNREFKALDLQGKNKSIMRPIDPEDRQQTLEQLCVQTAERYQGVTPFDVLNVLKSTFDEQELTRLLIAKKSTLKPNE
ncbi:hypothetical protein KBC75_02795 [Candidatus Shapirobacteria bacterium]|nr:hypothetical protein [Candidatus Shapirobacteria bacterium]